MEKKKSGLFYIILLCFLLALIGVFLFIRLALLRPWLVRFEASQPKHTSQEVFAQLFSNRDWDKVYDLSGVEGDREDFVRWMEELTADRELTMVETSAGLSGDRRYIVKAGEDNVAAFTLAGEAEGKNTTWRLDGVELLMGRPADDVLIRTLAGWRVLVDGRELGEECQVQTTETAAERYLPEGVHGRRTVLWRTRGKNISVLDENGQELPLTPDPDSGCFTAEEPAEEPTDEERELLFGAAKVYARFMIRAADAAQLRRYFDSDSEIYRTIRGSEIWIKNTGGNSFTNETVSSFYRYGPDLFSARVSMHMDVKRFNGTSKPYEIDSTLFFHRKNGAWRAFEMTNMDVQEETVHTRLVFMDGEKELGSVFVSSQDYSFKPPAAPARPGERFVGWAVRSREGNQVTMTVQFRPGADGTVSLPGNTRLEPLILYAAYEKE